MDLAFAIDDLYSTGWWPGDSVPCVRSHDGRWFPEPPAVASLFKDAGRSFDLCRCGSGSACRASWTDSGGQPHATIGPDAVVAGLMALAEFRRDVASTGRPIAAG